jgi:protein TonB
VAVVRIKIEWDRSERKWHGIPAIDPRLIWGALALSVIIHLLSWLSAGFVERNTTQIASNTVKFRDLTQAEKKLMSSLKKDAAQAKRIIETKQTETEAPTAPSSMGAQDHKTIKETKLAHRMINNSKGLDAGPKSGEATDHSKTTIPPQPMAKFKPQTFTGPGTLSFSDIKTKPRNNYERLLPDKTQDVFATPKGGYMEHIEADVAVGDRIDMNTSSFRYISYFTGLRKQIEMVWIYPSDAIQRGLQGAVQLEMTIERDGHVSKARVLTSSGYQTLDDNMLKTIKLASPFAPLPKGWGKERLVVTGSFHYVLSYSSH